MFLYSFPFLHCVVEQDKRAFGNRDQAHAAPKRCTFAFPLWGDWSTLDCIKARNKGRRNTHAVSSNVENRGEAIDNRLMLRHGIEYIPEIQRRDPRRFVTLKKKLQNIATRTSGGRHGKPSPAVASASFSMLSADVINWHLLTKKEASGCIAAWICCWLDYFPKRWYCQRVTEKSEAFNSLINTSLLCGYIQFKPRHNTLYELGMFFFSQATEVTFWDDNVATSAVENTPKLPGCSRWICTTSFLSSVCVEGNTLKTATLSSMPLVQRPGFLVNTPGSSFPSLIYQNREQV